MFKNYSIADLLVTLQQQINSLTNSFKRIIPCLSVVDNGQGIVLVYLFPSLSCARCSRKAPSAIKKQGPKTLLPPKAAPKKDNMPNIKNTLPVVFICHVILKIIFFLLYLFRTRDGNNAYKKINKR